MKRLLIYLLRWQLSIPILALVTWWLMDFGTIVGSIVANLIGGLIFYKIDKLIFKNDTIMKEYNHWKVTIKEKTMSHPITSEFHGNYDEEDVIKHYGLKEDDVEWYKIEKLK